MLPQPRVHAFFIYHTFWTLQGTNDDEYMTDTDEANFRCFLTIPNFSMIIITVFPVAEKKKLKVDRNLQLRQVYLVTRVSTLVSFRA